MENGFYYLFFLRSPAPLCVPCGEGFLVDEAATTL